MDPNSVSARDLYEAIERSRRETKEDIAAVRRQVDAVAQQVTRLASAQTHIALRLEEHERLPVHRELLLFSWKWSLRVIVPASVLSLILLRAGVVR